MSQAADQRGPATERDETRELSHAPEELTRAPLRRLGEGIGKVVYASEHWVVKRERSPSAIIALIVIWKILRRLERLLPGSLGKRLVQRPARQIRVLRVFMQAIVLVHLAIHIEGHGYSVSLGRPDQYLLPYHRPGGEVT